MKKQAKRLEPLKYQAFGFIQASKGMPFLFSKSMFLWSFLRASAYSK
jgi:hypothetical protein